MKIKYACGLLTVFLLSALFAPLPAQAASEALRWTSVGKPGDSGNLVVTPSEVSEIAIGRDNVLYTIDGANSKLYRSLDAGVSWEDITFYLFNAGAGLPATRIAVAPDKPGIVAVVTNNGTKVYLSTDGGTKWTDIGITGFQGTIQAIAISSEYTSSNQSFWQIAIGTADWGDITDATTGQVWAREVGELWGTPWTNLGLTVDPSHIGGEVSALAYSPNYANDKTLLVVASTASSDVSAGPPIDYRNQTWLCLYNNTSGWNNPTGYPVAVASAGDGPGVSYIHSSLALPSDYSNNTLSPIRVVFVSYDREPDANDDVYRLIDTTVTRLNTDGGNPIDISSIAYYGTTTSGMLLAGDVSPVSGLLEVHVRRTSNPLGAPPTWYLSSVPPTGPGNAKVGWSSDGSIAYCGTGQLPGAPLDESAFSASIDGDKWRQTGLIDTVIKLGDIVPAPDSESLFITTYSPFGPEGIWRSAGDPLGRHWERLLTMDTSSNAVILRLSPNYADDYTMYAAEVGGGQIAVTHNRGNSWQWCYSSPWTTIVDMAVGDEQTLYVALPGGYVRKSVNEGRLWQSPAKTGLSDINMLAIVDEETVLVGGQHGDVAYSTDGGVSFTPIYEVIGGGSGDVQVVADVNYEENHTIYAATNVADEGIWRWVIGASTYWVQIDRAITDLGGGQSIGGLAVGFEGTLYTLRMEPSNSTTGGMTRSLNPSATDFSEVEFDLVNDALPAGTRFDPALAFLNTLPYLRLSGNAEQNELWTIGTIGTTKTIYRYQDTLCKLGPTPETPEDGGIVSADLLDYVTDLTLRWGELEGVTEYEAAIYLHPDATVMLWSGTSTYNAIVATDDSNPAQLLRGANYYWQARSIEPIKSLWSEVWSFLGNTWSPVTVLSPAPGASDVPTRPAFNWGAVDGATGYELVLARDSSFTDVVVALTGADALPINAWGCDQGLDYYTTYFWKVRAVSAISSGEWVNSAFTTEPAPSVPLPAQSSPTPSSSSKPTPLIPAPLMGVLIGVGVIVVVALLVFAVRTGR